MIKYRLSKEVECDGCSNLALLEISPSAFQLMNYETNAVLMNGHQQSIKDWCNVLLASGKRKRESDEQIDKIKTDQQRRLAYRERGFWKAADIWFSSEPSEVPVGMEVKRCGACGEGLFANRYFFEGQILGRYGGVVVPPNTEKRPESAYLMQIPFIESTDMQFNRSYYHNEWYDENGYDERTVLVDAAHHWSGKLNHAWTWPIDDDKSHEMLNPEFLMPDEWSSLFANCELSHNVQPGLLMVLGLPTKSGRRVDLKKDQVDRAELEKSLLLTTEQYIDTERHERPVVRVVPGEELRWDYGVQYWDNKTKPLWIISVDSFIKYLINQSYATSLDNAIYKRLKKLADRSVLVIKNEKHCEQLNEKKFCYVLVSDFTLNKAIKHNLENLNEYGFIVD